MNNMTNSRANWLERFFANPEWFVPLVVPEKGTAIVKPMSRGDYSRASFLDSRLIPNGSNYNVVLLQDIVQQYRKSRPASRPMNFIFHTAFCGSTLLCRCLDKPGVCLPYKEPFLLHQLGFSRRGMNMPFVTSGHPLSGVLSEDLGGCSLLELALAITGRTFSKSEIPVIKPTDSCINIASDLMFYHPDSAAILLYDKLESFIVTMLKKPERRHYMRAHIARARVDLSQLGLLGSINPYQLSDACAACFVWLGMIYHYLELVGGAHKNVRTLESAVFFETPEETLKAISLLFGLSLDDEHIRSVINGPVFASDAKNPDAKFEKIAREDQNKMHTEALESEIEEGLSWTAKVTKDCPVPDNLPCGLLDS